MCIEMVNIFDDNYNLIGSAPREQAHRKGLLHDVVHCWVYDPADGGKVWFQQRSKTKTVFPLYYDIAVGGHIGAGEDPLTAAIREVWEEIGLTLPEEDIINCGWLRKADYFYEGTDREIGRVFLFKVHDPIFALNDEVERMVYIPLRDYLYRFETDSVTAYTAEDEAVIIPKERWAIMSTEFEDYVLPHIHPAGELRYEFREVCEDLAMMSHALDTELEIIFGRTELRAEHARYNTLEGIVFCALAYDGHKVVGSAAVRSRGDIAEIKRVYVSPLYRCRGISKKLMEMVEEEAKKRGFNKMILETNVSLIPAMALYEKLGFYEIEKYPPYENMPDAFCMGKEIDR